MMENSNKPSIFVVDDDQVTKGILITILRGEGYPLVGEASNGIEAVKHYSELKPDIVLLDMTMPKMDGLHALEEIRKINPSAIILMLSAHFTLEKINEGIKKGAAGFVAKPFNAANALAKISECWHAKHK
jgi:two-component system chemotaxis response regulator CheY